MTMNNIKQKDLNIPNWLKIINKFIDQLIEDPKNDIQDFEQALEVLGWSLQDYHDLQK